MQKVDIAIGVLGAVALLATGLGIALYDDINGLDEYTVEKAITPIDHTGDVPAGGLTHDFDVPDNAYHAMFDVEITATSTNPQLSGTVDVSITVTTPDGQTITETGAFEFTDGTGTISVSTPMWGEAPEDPFLGSHEDAAAAQVSYDEPLTVEITIQGPSGPLPVVGQDDGSYSAAITGEFHGFNLLSQHPEPETA